jgi:hypothetical protein
VCVCGPHQVILVRSLFVVLQMHAAAQPERGLTNCHGETDKLFIWAIQSILIGNIC